MKFSAWSGGFFGQSAIQQTAQYPPTIGASQNSQSCPSAHPPTISAGPVLRAGFTEVLVTGILIKVDQSQDEAYRNRSESCRHATIGRAHDHE